MLETIGNTPLVQLRRLTTSKTGDVFVKLEGVNPTGSYKDRVALAMVLGAEAEGSLRPGTRLLECTGGSTGTSLAFVCAVKRIPLTIISSDAYAAAKLDSMRAFGAELLIEPSVGGKVTPDLWPRMRQRANDLVAAGNHIWVDQFENEHAPGGYSAMGNELVEQLDRQVDAFCGCVGTAGMITGVGRVLREHHPTARIIGLEPDTSAVLSGRPAGAHGIDGTAAGFVPPLFDRKIVTEVRALPERSARDMARRLALAEGIFAGTSTGMNVLAAIQLAERLGPGSTVVTIACDTGFKYLQTDLFCQ
ncbi:MAG: cysteine synthase family protein [bacterium]|nr:cysteine synthase family protein [bacterium]